MNTHKAMVTAGIEWFNANFNGQPDAGSLVVGILTAALTQAGTQPVGYVTRTALAHLQEDYSTSIYPPTDDYAGMIPLFASPVPAKREAGVVKPLKWEYVERPTMTYTAYWPDGDVAYYIDQSFGSDSFYFRTVRWPEETIYDGDDLPSAQAAAQSDYERRILSALATTEGQP